MGIHRGKLKRLRHREWLSDGAGRGTPSLRARGSASGPPRYALRYQNGEGQRVDLYLGAFADVEEAERVASGLIKRWRDGERNLHAALAADAAAAEAAKRAAEAAEAAARLRAEGTLWRLLSVYAATLEADGKQSARKVRALFERHVAPHPLAQRPAVDVTDEDVAALLHPHVAAGKRRTAALLRSTIRAAYRRAAGSHGNPAASPELKAFNVRGDPLGTVDTIKNAIRARERALSASELRAYWEALGRLPDPAGALLRFHLLTGAQRIEMLARATVANLDREHGVLTLRDLKGKRDQPRVHPVPLIPAALDELARLRGSSPTGPHVFTADRGATGAKYDAVRARLEPVVSELAQSGAVESAFTVGDLRRTVETRLAALGVPKEVRAHLQSHGLGGVQAKHYDKHDYDVEIRDALERLRALLTGQGAAVVPIRKRR